MCHCAGVMGRGGAGDDVRGVYVAWRGELSLLNGNLFEGDADNEGRENGGAAGARSAGGEPWPPVRAERGRERQICQGAASNKRQSGEVLVDIPGARS